MRLGEPPVLIPQRGEQARIGLPAGLPRHFLIFRRRHPDAGMDRPEDRLPRLIIEAVPEPVEPREEGRPERDPIGGRQGERDRAKARNMLVAHPPVLPARFDEAGLQAAGGLAEPDEHRSGTLHHQNRCSQKIRATTPRQPSGLL